MKHRWALAGIVLVVLLLFVGIIGGGIAIYRTIIGPSSSQTTQKEEESPSTLLPVNTSIRVSVRSSSKPNTIDLVVSNLEKKYQGISYEVTYETKGAFQGVNSGSRPLDVTDKDESVKEVYLGTCSKNVCVPHIGVSSVSVDLILIDTKGKRSRYSQDFPI